MSFFVTHYPEKSVDFNLSHKSLNVLLIMLVNRPEIIPQYPLFSKGLWSCSPLNQMRMKFSSSWRNFIHLNLVYAGGCELKQLHFEPTYRSKKQARLSFSFCCHGNSREWTQNWDIAVESFVLHWQRLAAAPHRCISPLINRLLGLRVPSTCRFEIHLSCPAWLYTIKSNSNHH